MAIFAKLESMIDDPVWERSYSAADPKQIAVNNTDTAEAGEKVDKTPADEVEDSPLDGTIVEE